MRLPFVMLLAWGRCVGCCLVGLLRRGCLLAICLVEFGWLLLCLFVGFCCVYVLLLLLAVSLVINLVFGCLCLGGYVWFVRLIVLLAATLLVVCGFADCYL